MKHKILSAVFIISVLFTVSCESDFDPEIYGRLFTTNFPKTESDYESYMMTCYIPFTVNWGYDLTGAWQHNFYVAEGGIIRLFDSTSDLCAPWSINTWGGSWLKWTQANFSDCILYGRGSGGDPSHFEKVRDVTRFTKIIGDLEEATALPDEKRKNSREKLAYYVAL